MSANNENVTLQRIEAALRALVAEPSDRKLAARQLREAARVTAAQLGSLDLHDTEVGVIESSVSATGDGAMLCVISMAHRTYVPSDDDGGGGGGGVTVSDVRRVLASGPRHFVHPSTVCFNASGHTPSFAFVLRLDVTDAVVAELLGELRQQTAAKAPTSAAAAAAAAAAETVDQRLQRERIELQREIAADEREERDQEVREFIASRTRSAGRAPGRGTHRGVRTRVAPLKSAKVRGRRRSAAAAGARSAPAPKVSKAAPGRASSIRPALVSRLVRWAFGTPASPTSAEPPSTNYAEAYKHDESLFVFAGE